MASDGWDDPEFLAYVRELHAQATRVRGNTPADSPRRKASARLSQLLAGERGRGVPVMRIARALGVTPTAINMRLQRHGYDKAYPSQEANYAGGFGSRRPTPERCRQGHWIDGTLSNGRRYCRTCDKRRLAERRARLRAS